MNQGLALIKPAADAAPGSPVLEIRNLGKVFRVNGGGLHVLDNIHFSARSGELICLLGRSGCGKSTILKIVAGFLQSSSGSIWVDGKPVTGPGPDRCMVFQEDALFPWLTVYENIAFGLKKWGRNRAEIRKAVDAGLDMVGLSEFRDYLPREISAGMKQRVALARVLILNPRILLMDEPFASLDAQTRREMQELLLRLWNDLNHTILFVTHDVDEAVLLADRVMVMDKSPGRLREIVDIRLPRPRRKDNPAFGRCVGGLYETLRM